MKFAAVLFVVFVAVICLGQCKDLITGTSFNNRLIWQQKVEYNAIPLKKRVKEVFYSDAGQQTIKGVIARDLDHTEGSASITAGGPGNSYVNVRFKSERGSGLNYQLEIYV
ncbi:probable salivary secreted peptide [Ostrinia nubilalis]|uniref:probable salivary secreted peptide n=1 Tax=Ostrinia nubilalis TaxID=29057 RepID=UPI0030823050